DWIKVKNPDAPVATRVIKADACRGSLALSFGRDGCDGASSSQCLAALRHARSLHERSGSNVLRVSAYCLVHILRPIKRAKRASEPFSGRFANWGGKTAAIYASIIVGAVATPSKIKGSQRSWFSPRRMPSSPRAIQ